MQEYRICVRDSHGQIIRQEVWQCHGDDEALEYARRLASRCKVEVWQSAVRVESLELGSLNRDYLK